MTLIIDRLLQIDWKAYVLALFGFVIGTAANIFDSHYGSIVSISMLFGGWWIVLAALFVASRKADLPLGKILK